MKNIIIIGGGASAILFIHKLINDAINEAEIIVHIVEKEKCFGGLAYNLAALPGMLMNNFIKSMSAFNDQPFHLLEWLNSSSTDKVSWPVQYQNKKWDELEFCPRIIYGFYLRHIFEISLQLAQEKNITVKIYEDNAIDVDLVNAPKVNILLESGVNLAGEIIVLCIGHLSYMTLPFCKMIENDSRFIKNFWAVQGISRFAGISIDEDTLIIGTGLTANDILLLQREKIEEDKRNNGTKKIGHTYLVSRHGLMHKPYPSSYTGLTQHEIKLNIPSSILPIKILKPVIKNLATELFTAGLHPEDIYRRIVGVLHPLWKSLPHDERVVIFNKYKYLDIYRTGVSRMVLNCINEMMCDNKLTLFCGKILSIRKMSDDFEVELLVKNTNENGEKIKSTKTVKVKSIINATGFNDNIQTSSSILVKNLLSKGMIVENYLGLGANCTVSGQIYSQNGSLLPIFAIGAATSGQSFDSRGRLGGASSIVGIRQQASNVNTAIFSFLNEHIHNNDNEGNYTFTYRLFRQTKLKQPLIVANCNRFQPTQSRCKL